MEKLCVYEEKSLIWSTPGPRIQSQQRMKSACTSNSNPIFPTSNLSSKSNTLNSKSMKDNDKIKFTSLLYNCRLNMPIYIQVSFAVRGGYIPHKYKSENTKSGILGLNMAKNGSFPSLFLSPLIVKNVKNVWSLSSVVIKQVEGEDVIFSGVDITNVLYAAFWLTR